MMINDSRQYSASNGRQYVWSDDELLLDPFGYYSQKRIIGHRVPAYGYLYYPDFPYESNTWHLDPPSEYDDNVEEQSFKQWSQQINKSNILLGFGKLSIYETSFII